jgi:hypothetical protein
LRWQNQTDKRTFLVEQVPIGDWFIIIDADETLLGDVAEAFEQFQTNGCISARIPLYNLGADKDRFVMAWHPRIFRKTEGMHYRGTHWHLRDRYQRFIEDKYPLDWTDKIVLCHFKGFKPQKRLLPHTEYMQALLSQGWIEPKDAEQAMKGAGMEWK